MPAPIITPRLLTVHRQTWWLLIALSLLTLVLFCFSGLGITFNRAAIALYVFAGFLSVAWFYSKVRRDDKIAFFGSIAAQLLLATAITGILSYLTARVNFPLRDEQLIAIDHSFSFDWLVYLAWMNEHPQLERMLDAIYFSIDPELLIIILLLFFAGKIMQLQRLCLAFIFTALLTILVAMLIPAVGGYLHHNVDITQYGNLNLAVARVQAMPMFGLRDHSFATLVFPLQGIVTFPSFHTVMALLMLYCGLSFRYLSLITVPLNILIVVSTPVSGGHYLSDALGGIIVALVGIMLAEYLLPRRMKVDI